MDFIKHSYLNSEDIISSNADISFLWRELSDTINSISDKELIDNFLKSERKAKSLSDVINKSLDLKLTEKGWRRQSRIFKDQDTYTGTTWTLDFSKVGQNPQKLTTGIAVEVVFNHGEAIAWNLIKLSLAAENNFVRKETDIGSGIGVYICATAKLKELGGFDGAVGEYEKVLKYLDPLSAKIIRPILIVGLLPPHSFRIRHSPNPENKSKKIGKIEKY